MLPNFIKFSNEIAQWIVLSSLWAAGRKALVGKAWHLHHWTSQYICSWSWFFAMATQTWQSSCGSICRLLSTPKTRQTAWWNKYPVAVTDRKSRGQRGRTVEGDGHKLEWMNCCKLVFKLRHYWLCLSMSPYLTEI